MSQVYARNRKETSFQFFDNAKKLTKTICRFSNSKTYFPKKYKFSYSQHLRLKAFELLDNVSYAYAIYPSTQEKVNEKKDYISKAIANCYQLQNILDVYIDSIETIKFENIDFIEELEHEKVLLEGWRKGIKILKDT